MAGHSKSSNIKHRKNAQDTKRSRLFTKLAREITVAARENPDSTQNPRLRLAKERALAANIKKETIEKAIKKVTEPSDVPMEAIRYEGYGPSGIPILVDVFTDNRNRTASDLRYAFNRQGGNLGTAGSVTWLFTRKGLIKLSEDGMTEEKLMTLALETGAEDIILLKDSATPPRLITSQENLVSVVENLSKRSVSIVEASTTWLPITRVTIEDAGLLSKMQNFITVLEDLSDVEAVYTGCSWQLE